MRQQSYFGCGGCRRHNREDCGRGSRAYVPDVSEVFRAFSVGLQPPSVFSGYTPLFATRPGVKLRIRQLCSTCVLQICSMDVLQRNNKQNQTTVRSNI